MLERVCGNTHSSSKITLESGFDATATAVVGHEYDQQVLKLQHYTHKTMFNVCQQSCNAPAVWLHGHCGTKSSRCCNHNIILTSNPEFKEMFAVPLLFIQEVSIPYSRKFSQDSIFLDDQSSQFRGSNFHGRGHSHPYVLYNRIYFEGLISRLGNHP